jgi:hypothetical protein
MNRTVETLTEDKRYEFTGAGAFCSIANRSATRQVYVDLLDQTGGDTYELTGQGDRIDIDLTGARTMTIRASAYPCDVLLNITNQRVALASPSLDVTGGLNAVSPLPVTAVSTSTPTFFDFTEQGAPPAAADGVVRAYGTTAGLFYETDEAVITGPLIDTAGARAAFLAVIDSGAGAPAAVAPAAGHYPLYYDTTAVTGGLYFWNGAAWVHVTGTT